MLQKITTYITFILFLFLPLHFCGSFKRFGVETIKANWKLEKEENREEEREDRKKEELEGQKEGRKEAKDDTFFF